MTPDPDSLPFLVAHGGWFWIVLVLALALVVVGLVVTVKHVIAVIEARAWIAKQRAAVVQTLAEGDLVVQGRWHNKTIKVGDEHLKLGHTSEVVLGRKGNRLEDGDEVLVAGRLSRLAVGEPSTGGYRDDAGTWQVDGANIYAVRPRIRAKRMAWPARIIGLVCAVLGSYATLHVVGVKAAGRLPAREYTKGNGRPLVVDNFSTISIAAGLPGGRDKALLHFEFALERHPYRDALSVRRQLALSDLIHGPCGRLEVLDKSGLHDELLAVANRCGDKRAAFNVQVQRGEFEAAWTNRAAIDWPEREGMVAIAIGNWGAAAELAEEIAIRNDRETQSDRAAHAIHEALRFRCLSQWFRTLAGDAGAADKLRVLAKAEGSPPIICAAMLAQILPPDQRKKVLSEAVDATPSGSYDLIGASVTAMRLRWLDGESGPNRSLFDFGITKAIGEGDTELPGWLARLGIERWRGTDDVRNFVAALSGVVLQEVHRGDFAAALRAVDEATATAQARNDKWAERDALQWRALVALRDGSTQLPARGHVDDLVASLPVRRGETPRHGMAGYPQSCEPLLASAVSDAQRGDGAPLARAMQSCSVYWIFSPGVVLGVLPLVKQGRAELATALRWWHQRSHSSYEPFSSLAYAALRRDMARMIGDDKSAERWAHDAKRLLKPLEDPTRTLALVLWNG